MTGSSRPSRALVLHGPEDLRLETRETPYPAAGEVQIAIRATGLCGSDLHYFYQGRNGDFVVRAPLCLGHESAGTVTALGADVTTLQAGDRVALEVGIPCRKCTLCLQDRYNLCSSMRFRSSAAVFPHLDGTLMDITNHPAMLCHKLPPTISDVQAALIEPLAVCIHAVNRSKLDISAIAQIPQRDVTALIFGAGAIGLLLACVLAASQPFTAIVVADINTKRLQIASTLPYTNITPHHLLAKQAPSSCTPEADDDYAKSIAAELAAKFTLPHGFTRVYDCTGSPSCIRAAIHASSPGGAVVLVGMGGPRLPTLPLSFAALREIDLIGVLRYDGRCYPEAVRLMASGKLDGVTERIVTHTVEFGNEGGQKAFRLAGNGVDDEGNTVVKVVVMGEKR
ncbi:zinc-dependent alcohol dehydrogenase [Coccidioides immitis RS]|uniref:Zinc-dependent alcohol dehydrogenase n=3 Tax=Coccidioides immitis TaxID=5501 RepID=J3KAT9_COCIM|nr:zinc-dependent alcohol dehydrogenase [Coccidioides immitis RS]EAS32168.3 zinc-dependent alcohol dehydrogenase [Coccidioides immitis RS]KMP07372.1 sorbitol dehydrogenase [Coccidioides immitis RMSCC 2394]KMU82449.1 sorbitol dehydrogenase [Coccidioides immitis H538.4]